MALVLADRVKQTSSSLGTGSIIVGGSVVGYQTFAAIGNGNSTYYTIAGQGTSEWEVGIGTYTAAGTTLSRDTVLASSNGGAKVNFSAGVKDVFVTYPSERSVYTNSATNTLVASGNLPVTNLNSGTGASNTTFWRGDGTWAVPAGGGTIIGSGTANYVPKFVDSFEIGNSLIQDDGVGVGIGAAPNSSALLVVNGRAQATELEVYAAYPTLILTDTANGDNPYYIYQAGDTLIFQDNAAERMRIASGGAIGFGGANYGTSGQVLTSRGSGLSPIWTTPTYGTVTSVAALTLGTTGTDLSSTVANSTTTPVITLNVPTASATNRGALSSTDWTTFNSKVTSVSGTSGRITSTGGTTPVLDLTSGIATAGTTGSSSLIPVVTVDTYGRVTSITTASNPQGTVTSVNGTGSVNGITLTGTVTSTGNLTLGGTLSNVSLATQVTGNLPVTNLNNGLSASATTFWRGDGTWATPIDTGITSISIASSNGLAGTSSGGTTPILTLSTTVTGLLKGNGTSISAATSGTDYAPATSGTSILYGNGTGGFSNVTIGSGVSFVGGTLSATGSGGTVTSVTGTSPIVSSGGTTPAISIPAATSTVSGYLTSTDWTTFNNKGSGSVTSVAALTLGTTGTDLSSTVANGTTTPVITLNVPTASATNRGALSSTDWTTFNNKVTSVSGTTGRITSTGGTTPVIDLASGVATAGTTGSSTLIPVVTIDTYGRVTSITTASNPQGTVTSVATSGSVNGITLTGGTITSSGTITLGGTLSGVSLTTQVTGTLPVGNGGTGAITLTGYVKGSGTSAFTASSTIPNTDITGLGTMSTQNASSVAITGGSINGTTIGAGTAAAGTFTNITLTTGTISTTPTFGNDIVNKSYADSIATGVNYHPSVQYASAATLTSTSGAYTYSNGTGGVGATITGPVNTALIIDGHTMVAGDVTAGTRVLLKNETGAYVNTTTPSAAFNGAYVVTQIATVSVGWVLTRATDYDTSGSGTNEIDQGDFFYVVYGTANTNTSWIQQTALPITVGTTQITFVQFGAATFYTAGTGLTLSGSNQFSITNTGVTANTYGSASSVPVLTVNAQGQLTSVTNTPIAINVSAVTGAVTGVTATAPVVSSGGTAPVISIPAATGSVSGYLSSTDWTTFNNKVTSVSGTTGRITSTGGTTPVLDLTSGVVTAGTTGSSSLIPVVTVDTYGRVTSITTAANPQGTVTAVSVSTANGFAGSSSGGATPSLTLTTTVTGMLKGNGTAISAAAAGTDYAPATVGSSILYGNSLGGFSNVTIGTGLLFSAGTLSATTTATISGSGTTNYVPKFTSSTAIGDSVIYDDGTNVGIGTSSPAAKLHVVGDVYATGNIVDNGTGGGRLTFSPSGAVNTIFSTTTGFAAYNPLKYVGSYHQWFNGGSEVMRIDSSGNVGIGTSSPAAKLDISGAGSSAAITGRITNTDSTGYSVLNLRNSGTSGKEYQVVVGGHSSGSPDNFYIYDATSNAVRMLIDTSGNVGIGTSSPDTKLTISGLTTANSQSDLSIQRTGATSYLVGQGPAIQFTNVTDNSACLIQQAAGNLQFFNYTTGVGWWAERMRIDSSGNVGIGTSSPATKLHVNGVSAFTKTQDTTSLQTGFVANNTSGNFYLALESSTPSLAFNTGTPNARLLYSDGAYPIIIATNSTERMRIDSSGNVGIGTSSPSGKLTVRGASVNSYLLIDNVAAGENYFAANSANIFQTAGTERMRIDSSGNVGIGTSSPSYKLDVRGAVAAGNGTITGGISYSTRTEIGSFSNHNLGFITNNTTQMLLDTSGNLSVGSGTNVTTVGQKTISFYNTGSSAALIKTSDDTSEFTSAALNKTTWAFYTSNAERMRIDNSGNVGIGTSSPATTLDLGMGLGRRLSLYTDPSDALLGFGVDIGGGSYELASYAGGAGTGKGKFTWQQYNRTTNTYTERMRIDSSGNVGIGTSSPAKKLDVNGDALINGVTVGLGGGSISGNAVLGYAALYSNTAGAYNVAIGYQALYSNTTANSNVAIGLQALYTNTTGYDNVGIGHSALYYNNGAYNVAIGREALVNATGSYNIGLGNNAGSALTTQNYCVVIGGNSGSGMTSQQILISDGAGTERMRIDSSGNVGIGTSSPSSVLHVSTSSGNPTITVSGSGAYTSILDLQAAGAGSSKISATGGSNQLVFSTNSVDRMYINSSGNVGIGTSSPAAKLDVSSGHVKLTDGYSYCWGDYSTSINGNSSSDFMSFYTASAERLRIDSSGNVGIGTSSPAAKLDVAGDIYVRTGNRLLTDTVESYTGGATPLALKGANTITFTTGFPSYTERMRITSAGNVGIGTSSPNAQFHVSGGGSGSVFGYATNALITQSDSYSWGLAIQNATAGSNYAILQYVADDGTAFYESGDGAGAYQTNLRYAPSLGGALDLFALSYIAFNTNGATEAVRITSTGNVGIGTSSPAQKLDVAGAIKTTGGLLPRAASNANQTSPWAWSSASYDQQAITALANALTINADSGSPVDGQKTTFRIKDNGTGRALTWTTGSAKSFRAIGVTLPTTTVANKTVYVGCIYNAADSRWDVVSVAQEA